MTVTYSLVAIASRGDYVPTGESDTTYTALKAVASARLETDAPEGMNATLYDWCHALMITHLALADATAGYKSYSTEGLSISQDPGQTIFLLEYKQIIESQVSTSGTSTEETDYTRADANMPDFHLDQADVPTFYSEV